MKSNFSKQKVSKESIRVTTNTAEQVQASRLHSSKPRIKTRPPSSNKRSLKRLTLNMFNQERENSQDRRRPARMTTSKDRSMIPSYAVTPSRQLTVLMTNTTQMQQCKSATRFFTVGKCRINPCKNRCLIYLYYGETVISQSFDTQTQIREVHLYFFQEMVRLEKGHSCSRVLPFIALEGIKFDSYLDYWINQREEHLGLLTSVCGDQLHLRPVMAVRPPRNITINDFQVHRCIGVGGFSKVYLAKCNFTGELCAMKFISKQYILNSRKEKLLHNQREVLAGLDHPNLISLHYAFQTKHFIVFVIECTTEKDVDCPNNQLYQYLMEKGRLGEAEAHSFFNKVLQGVRYLHERKIIYRDIKLENILVDANGEIKISDFGLSKPRCEDTDLAYTYCGSPEYMAPEMLMKRGHSYEVDYYALGILLYELLVGRSPFVANTKQQIYYQALNKDVNFPKDVQLSKEVKGLIRGLLHKHPGHRIGTLFGIKQILSHPWMRKSFEEVPNPFYGTPFREYIESREPSNSYIEKQAAEQGNYEHIFPQMYYQNPKFERIRKQEYSDHEYELKRIKALKGQRQLTGSSSRYL